MLFTPRNRSPVMWRRVCAGVLAAAVSVIVVVGSSSAVYADEVRDGQWYLDDLGVDEAHELSRGAGVTIGLIDTGVDASHADVERNVVSGKDFGSSTDDGLNDAGDHGTRTASILAGHGDGDSGGVLGVAPEAEVISVGIDWEEQKDVDPNWKTDAIRWLAEQDVDIISINIGGTPGEKADLEYALDKGIPVVAPAGNTRQNLNDDVVEQSGTAWPARAEGVIPVTGTTKGGEFWGDSLTLQMAAKQPQLGLSAPAEDIPTASADGGHETKSGTSLAGPIVAGTLALIKSAYPDLDYWDAMYRLQLTVDDKGDEGWDEEYGWGIVNPLEALSGDVELDDGSVSTQDDILPLEEQGRESGGDGDGGSADGESDAGVLTGSSGVSWLPVAVVAGAVLLAAATITPIVVSRSRKKKRAAVAGGSPHPDGFAAGPPPAGFPAGPAGTPSGPVNPTSGQPAEPPSAPPRPAGSDGPWASPSQPSDSDRQ